MGMDLDGHGMGRFWETGRFSPRWWWEACLCPLGRHVSLPIEKHFYCGMHHGVSLSVSMAFLSLSVLWPQCHFDTL